MPYDGTAEEAPAGFLPRLRAAIGQPFTAPVTWGRLALIVGFVIVVALIWRNVILYIADE